MVLPLGFFHLNLLLLLYFNTSLFLYFTIILFLIISPFVLSTPLPKGGTGGGSVCPRQPIYHLSFIIYHLGRSPLDGNIIYAVFIGVAGTVVFPVKDHEGGHGAGRLLHP